MPVKRAYFLSGPASDPGKRRRAAVREHFIELLLEERMEVTRLEHSEPESRFAFAKPVLAPWGPPSVDPSREVLEVLARSFEEGALLWVSGLRYASYVTAARKLGYRVIFDQVSAESNALFDAAFSSPQSWPAAIRAARCAYWEERVCSAAHAVAIGSQIDAARIRKLVPRAPVHVIPAWVDIDHAIKTRGPSSGVFVTSAGSDPAEHARALRWFGENILPRLRAALGPDAMPTLEVAGLSKKRFEAESLGAFGFARLEAKGDWPRCLERAQGAFFPSVRGSDCRLAIVEAMAAGVPVICTGRAAEGLRLDPGQDVLLAERPDAFASAWMRLQDPGFRSKLAERATESVRARHDWRASRPTLEVLLQSLG